MLAAILLVMDLVYGLSVAVTVAAVFVVAVVLLWYVMPLVGS